MVQPVQDQQSMTFAEAVAAGPAQAGSFRVKLSYQGIVQGYLSRNDSNWATLVSDPSAATKLHMYVDGDKIYYGTDDNWWLSVATALGRRGYVGFYWWTNAGNATWQYDKASKRLTSGVNGEAMSIHGNDGYIYCWSGYSAADVELENV